jgi:hypothetical protein
MSRVPLRSFAFLTVFIVAVIAGCKSADTISPTRGPDKCASAGNGRQHHDTPLVCVDGSGAALTVHPESIRVWDVDSTSRSTPPKIVWLARNGTNLQITMKDAGCVDTPRCNGRQCNANIKNGIGAGHNEGDVLQTCRYTVTLDGRVLDPDTVIVRCCSDSFADDGT